MYNLYPFGHKTDCYYDTICAEELHEYLDLVGDFGIYKYAIVDNEGGYHGHIYIQVNPYDYENSAFVAFDLYDVINSETGELLIEGCSKLDNVIRLYLNGFNELDIYNCSTGYKICHICN